MLKALFVLGVLAVIVFLFVSYQVSSSRGSRASERAFRVNQGENILAIGDKLQQQGLIQWKWYFVYYAWKEDLRQTMQAGDYVLKGSMTIPEIARIISQGDILSTSVTVTFPEGWDMRKMADRLNANGLPGDEFLALARKPLPEWREQYVFLKGLPDDTALEGFLFPDTYTFAEDVSAQDIVARMLRNFNEKAPANFALEASRQGRTLFEVVTMASIVENEVRSTTDRKQVADLFWRRMDIGQPLQSDATVKYILGKNKIQHSFEETRVESPYNTYVNKGLPPGPISNPGLDSLSATLFPTANPYYYFLNNPETGETVFSVTFDEHKINKEKHGL